VPAAGRLRSRCTAVDAVDAVQGRYLIRLTIQGTFRTGARRDRRQMVFSGGGGANASVGGSWPGGALPVGTAVDGAGGVGGGMWRLGICPTGSPVSRCKPAAVVCQPRRAVLCVLRAGRRGATTSTIGGRNAGDFDDPVVAENVSGARFAGVSGERSWRLGRGSGDPWRRSFLGRQLEAGPPQDAANRECQQTPANRSRASGAGLCPKLLAGGAPAGPGVVKGDRAW